MGSIDLIAAPDLASRTVEPSTFLEFVRGRLVRLFIRRPDDLRARIASAQASLEMIEHALACEHDDFTLCPEFRAAVFERLLRR